MYNVYIHININIVEGVVELQFIQIKNKKVYPTWVATYHGYKVYIYMLVMTEVYHFAVYKHSELVYSSIENKLYFTEFDETVTYIEEWAKDNLKRDDGDGYY